VPITDSMYQGQLTSKTSQMETQSQYAQHPDQAVPFTVAKRGASNPSRQARGRGHELSTDLSLPANPKSENPCRLTAGVIRMSLFGTWHPRMGCERLGCLAASMGMILS